MRWNARNDYFKFIRASQVLVKVLGSFNPKMAKSSKANYACVGMCNLELCRLNCCYQSCEKKHFHYGIMHAHWW